MKKTIKVTVEVETDCSQEITEKAIRRGVFVGLDRERVAPPSKVDVSFGEATPAAEKTPKLSDLGLNSILLTRDGRKIGNAIIVGRHRGKWAIITDYGNGVSSMEDEDILKSFYVDNDPRRIEGHKHSVATPSAEKSPGSYMDGMAKAAAVLTPAAEKTPKPLRRRDIKLKMKVVPFRKSFGEKGTLSSVMWRNAREKGQPFLYVVRIESNRITLSDSLGYIFGDYFLASDVYLYEG